ncbi:hypothetical protein ASPVEDRAFT_40283 [Aspergillus versicolor CBS 583.65]|uniref:Uncharacterized protein n=1 Tax=Aspergillus versicolor CBS 583.65 TaxID=1036611 RepID=A0A1L9PGU3_ASPVE|nr:uncharacterized protein ASPVEDRAFT_40283 [Aspergillus versicolor CBS 583.65]OJJ00747.1 hypothetical protein ASPVEDRAFT_40283 [Aspergillus versicolor CBS 583.65]
MAEILPRMVTATHFASYQRLAIAPIKEIIDCGSENPRGKKLEAWKKRKIQQLHYVQLAATVMLAVDVQCLSWPTEDRHWTARAFWYWCTVLDVFAIGMSSQQLSILQYLESCEVHHNLLLDMIAKDSKEGKHTDSNMVYVWECPMMLLVHSMILFIVAVSVHVSYPLINGPRWGFDSKIASVYLVALGMNFFNLLYCSYWIYKKMPIF